MTEKISNAIKTFSQLLFLKQVDLPVEEINSNIEIAIECMEKQIPKKVRKENWTDTKCKCGYCFSKSYPDGYYDIPLDRQTKHCPNCGQKLDWGDEE